MCAPSNATKTAWPSRMLAENSAELHRMLHPGCTLIDAFPCSDHWHIGHRRLPCGTPGRDDCPPPQWPVYGRKEQTHEPV